MDHSNIDSLKRKFVKYVLKIMYIKIEYYILISITKHMFINIYINMSKLDRVCIKIELEYIIK